MRTYSLTIKRKIFSVFDPKNVKAIVLFGSRARGDYNNDSDYDINVFLDKNYNNFLDKKISGLNDKVYISLITPKDFKYLRKKAHPFLYCVFRDGIPLYQRNSWFERVKRELINLKPLKETAKKYIISSTEILTSLNKKRVGLSSFYVEEGKMAANKLGFGILMLHKIYPKSPHTLSKQLVSLDKRYKNLAKIIKYLQDKYYQNAKLKERIYYKKLNTLRKLSHDLEIAKTLK